MNRRTFLKMLGLAPALPLAAKLPTCNITPSVISVTPKNAMCTTYPCSCGAQFNGGVGIHAAGQEIPVWDLPPIDWKAVMGAEVESWNWPLMNLK